MNHALLPLAPFVSLSALGWLLAKVTLILAAGLLAAAVLGRRSAAARHLVLLLALAGSLGVVLLTPIAPRFAVLLPKLPAIGARVFSPAAATHTGVLGLSTGTTRPLAGAELSRSVAAPRKAVVARPLSMAALAFGLWLAGCGLVMLWSLLGHLLLFRLRRGSAPVEGAHWRELLASAPQPIASQVHLGSSPAIGTPLTWGWPNAMILLPRAADRWPLARRRVALLHELAHVARRDYLAQTIATLACSLYWFHPLVWLAAHRLRLESELACDDQVLAHGTPAAEYAADLLEVARHAGALHRAGFVAIGMARRSHLEGRLLAVLDDTRLRGVLSRRMAFGALAIAALVLIPLAGLRPQRAAAGEEHGKIVERGTRTIDRELQAAPGGQLDVRLETGASLVVRGWDQAKVHVHAELDGDDWRDTEVTVNTTKDGVDVHSEQRTQHENSSTSHRFTIEVPDRYDVHVSSAGGSIELSNLHGHFTGHTGGGQLRLDHLNGDADLTTGGGGIHVTDSRLDGAVMTGGGQVHMEHVQGDLQGMTGSSSGQRFRTGNDEESLDDSADDSDDDSQTQVSDNAQKCSDVHAQADADDDDDSSNAADDDASNSDDADYLALQQQAQAGFVHVNKLDGDVEIATAPHGAQVLTAGGDVQIGSGAGHIEVTTGGGDISIGPVAGSVSANSGAGDISIRLASAPDQAQDVTVNSGTGDVALELPADLDARVEIETAYTNNFERATRIESDWTLERETTDRWDGTDGTPRKYVRGHATFGHGRGLIRIHTVNGDIRLTKTSD